MAIPGKADLEARLAAGATAEELLSHPHVLEAENAMRQIPETIHLPGYGSRAFEAARRFLFGNEEVIGYPAAIARLYDASGRWSAGPVRQDQVATIVLGPPAAGKSKLSEALAATGHARIVDPDEAKAVLPEFKGGLGANATHEESGRISDQVLNRAITAGDNIILPKVGGDPEKILSTIRALHELGYRVELANLAVPYDTAVQRMIGRFLGTGRLINPDYVRKIAETPTRTYNLLKEHPLVERAQNFDGTQSADAVAQAGRDFAQFHRNRGRDGGKLGEEPGTVGGAAAPGGQTAAVPREADQLRVAPEPASPFAGNPNADLKPIATPTGEVRLAPPDELAAELARPAHLVDAVLSCKG